MHPKDHSVYSIFFIKGGGRFGNQLLLMCHFLAFCFHYQKTYKLRLVNIKFSKFYRFVNEHKPIYYFNSAGGENYPLFIRIISIAYRFNLPYFAHHFSNAMAYTVLGNPFKKIVRIKSNENAVDLASINFEKDLLKNRKLALCGWQFRCWSLLAKYKEEIRTFLKPHNRYYDKTQLLF